MPTERETPSTQISDIPALLPLDDYHRQLQRNAHPTDWVPPPNGRYNLVVIGAGTAGPAVAWERPSVPTK